MKLSATANEKLEGEWRKTAEDRSDFVFSEEYNRPPAMDLLAKKPGETSSQTEWDITGGALLGPLGRIITYRLRSQALELALPRSAPHKYTLERAVTVHRSGLPDFDAFGGRPAHWDREKFTIEPLDIESTDPDWRYHQARTQTVGTRGGYGEGSGYFSFLLAHMCRAADVEMPPHLQTELAHHLLPYCRA